MLLMPILPMMLIGTILVVSALDSRGLLGPSRRMVSLHVPLSAIAAGLSLAAAAVKVSESGNSQSADLGGMSLLAAICFQVGWALVHVRFRSAASATVGMLGTGAIIFAWLTAQVLERGISAPDAFMSAVVWVGLEVALVLALVPQVAPTLSVRLSERMMKVQRATVLAGFCLASTILFASLALVG